MWLAGALALLIASTLLFYEMRTSSLQSRWFSKYASKLTWEVRPGACEVALPAPQGPYDERLGYANLRRLQEKLTARDFRISKQACPSPELAKLARRGIAPPYDEKHTGTFAIFDREGKDLYRAPGDRFAFQEFSEIPALLVQSLLYVENRQLLAATNSSLNPAVEWDRLFFAGTHYAVDIVTRQGGVQGGSTLATQIEKFRHSPNGRTSGGFDKMRQIFGASLRAYRDGTDTRGARREIILDYLNSMPLGAAPGEGEITGFGHGMWAWFGKSPDVVMRDLTLTEEDANLPRKAETYKQALALVMATRRPTLYLSKSHKDLTERLESYLPLMVEEGILSDRMARAVTAERLEFLPQVPARKRVAFVDRKATNAVRAELLDLLDVPNLYALDRYDLRVDTSIDAKVQERVTSTLRQLTNADYLARRGFYGKHLLSPSNDPSKLIYSFALYEASPDGNRLRVSADNLDKPLDINRNVKLELGSTAKLRTMANYLMVVAELHATYRALGHEALIGIEYAAVDPISRWTAGWMRMHPKASLEDLLDASLNRTFSADPGEGFFTGRGMHYFSNFDSIAGPVTLKSAFKHSVNLVYIRLMRELVQYYTARLDYDPKAILADQDHPQREELLEAAIANEARETLLSFYWRYDDLSYSEALARMCGKDARGLRRLAIFALGEEPDASFESVRDLAHRVYPLTTAAQDSLLRSYYRTFVGKIHNEQDEAYLLGRHRLEVWLVRDLRDHPGSKWSGVLERSEDAREASAAWIRPRRFKEAQNLRIRIELERRAFREIHAAWQRLGYPFDSLVPSLATSIGVSADRPRALAELVGIIQRNGQRAPLLRVEALHFGVGTPYETHFAPAQNAGEQVMPVEVAAALQDLMRGVVEGGTARRIQGVLTTASGRAIPIGGKTGSGDNRSEKVTASGAVISSRAVNRTASFVFTIGDRFFGMMSAYVDGEQAAEYAFTSTLALQAFRAIAPAIEPMVRAGEAAGRETTEHAAAKPVTAVPATASAAKPPATRSYAGVAIAARP